MNNNLQEAFIILAVGMITVFAILSLVVFTGQILIKITNKYAPPQTAKINISDNPISTVSSPSNTINKKKLAAIIATVDHLTHGKGRIEKIKKR
jgi:Na+-transporting methylmalonyl-CoA/oxaloacetate decarboxylase gamma subunit